MVRCVLAVAAVLAVCGAGWAQEKKPDDKQARLRAEHERQMAESRAKFFKDRPTELPDLVEKVRKGQWSPPPVAEEEKSDTPAVRAGKRALRAEMERCGLINLRIVAGSFAGGSGYNQLNEYVFGMYAAATVVWDDPAKVLPYAEAVVVQLMKAEEFNAPRAKQGGEEPQLMPQLEAARYKAEAVVLKLREKIAAQKKGDATSSPAPTPPPVYVLVESPPLVVLPRCEPAPPRLFARWRR